MIHISFMNFKILKKIVGIFGFKLVEKKLFKNNRLLSNYSFLSTKKILTELFNQKKINSIVQIGANDGVRFDELDGFINEHKIQSLLVEPIKSNFEKLKTKYYDADFVKLENSAILINEQVSYLYKVDNKHLIHYDKHVPGITSFDKNHLLKHGVKKKHIIKEKVNSINVKELLNKYNIKNLDLLYIDAEGYDGKIVIDFLMNTSLRPIIIFEYIHINNKTFNTLLLKINEANYKIFSINENIFCIPSSSKISISL